MNLVITGSRDWPEDAENIIALVLDRLFWNDEESNHCYVGDCPTGVDKIVRDHLSWVNDARVPVQLHVFEADWDAYGKAAGPTRNAAMLNAAKTGLVVAFHPNRDYYLDLHRQRQGKQGSSGTNHCANLARRMGFRVYDVIGNFGP